MGAPFPWPGRWAWRWTWAERVWAHRTATPAPFDPTQLIMGQLWISAPAGRTDGIECQWIGR